MYNTTQTAVLFDDPFWIALFERKIDGQYSVARAIIGTSEPLGAHLADFFEHLDYDKLQFSVPVEDISMLKKEISFKKQLHRNKETQNKTLNTYTKAQAMLKQQQSIIKAERKQESRLVKNEEKQFKYEIRQHKKKKKQKGH
jgi:hypothetical protein